MPTTTGCRPSESCLPGAGRSKSFSWQGDGVESRQAKETGLQVLGDGAFPSAHGGNEVIRKIKEEHHARNSEMV